MGVSPGSAPAAVKLPGPRRNSVGPPPCPPPVRTLPQDSPANKSILRARGWVKCSEPRLTILFPGIRRRLRWLRSADTPCGATIHRSGPDAGPPDVRAPGADYYVFPALDVADFDICSAAVSAAQELQAARAVGAKALAHCHALQVRPIVLTAVKSRPWSLE